MTSCVGRNDLARGKHLTDNARRSQDVTGGITSQKIMQCLAADSLNYWAPGQPLLPPARTGVSICTDIFHLPRLQLSA